MGRDEEEEGFKERYEIKVDIMSEKEGSGWKRRRRRDGGRRRRGRRRRGSDGRGRKWMDGGCR